MALKSGTTHKLTHSEVRVMIKALAFLHALPERLVDQTAPDLLCRKHLLERLKPVIERIGKMPTRPGFDATWRFEPTVREKANIVAALTILAQNNSQAASKLLRKFA